MELRTQPVRFIMGLLKVSKSSITLLAGEKSRQKKVVILGDQEYWFPYSKSHFPSPNNSRVMCNFEIVISAGQDILLTGTQCDRLVD
jgi:hypothetical protein